MNALSGKRKRHLPVSEGHPACHEPNREPGYAHAHAQAMLHGVQPLWLAGIIPGLTLSTTAESTARIVAALVVCALLLWNFILKKRFARYRHFSSRQSERYRQFFDNCPDALLVVEHEGSIVSANAHACKLLKVDGQELLAKTFWHFVAGTSRPEFNKQFALCMSGKKMRCEGELQDCNGTIIPVEVNGSLQYTEGNKLVLLYIRDISDLREVEDQVRSLYNQLETVSVELEDKERAVAEETRLARKELITFANHRIRTPLDGIMGMAQLLADTSLNIEQSNCVYTILNSSASLLNVVRAMSEESEDNPEEIELKAEFVNLREICKTLYRQYELFAARKGIDFRCDCQSNVPMHVVTDGRLLSQVLSTMLDNAIKFTEQGLVMLNIECRRCSSESAELYFHVIDTGWGIDKQFQSIIFEKSDQYADSRFARRDGGGLDLATSSEVVERMGGTIGLNSTKGKGSTFYFSLTFPLALPQPSIDDADPVAAISDSTTGTINDAVVLVVEDNKISQKVVVAMLRKAGCEVDAVGNGRDAITQIRKKHYDVILMDCQMPVMDGYEATTEIRAMAEPFASIPIIALTAHSLRHELMACRKCGMDDHLVKPVDRKLLISTVDKYAHDGRQQVILESRTAS